MKKEYQNHQSSKGFPGILFGVLVITVLLLSACQSSAQPYMRGNPGVAATQAPTATAANPSQNQSKSQTITLINTSFDPKQLSVAVGTTVVWTNKDSMAHTVTADDKSFDSGNLNTGDTFKFTFTKAGTYPYHCQYHGGPNGVGMSGVITVTGQ